MFQTSGDDKIESLLDRLTDNAKEERWRDFDTNSESLIDVLNEMPLEKIREFATYAIENCDARVLENFVLCAANIEKTSAVAITVEIFSYYSRILGWQGEPRLYFVEANDECSESILDTLKMLVVAASGWDEFQSQTLMPFLSESGPSHMAALILCEAFFSNMTNDVQVNLRMTISSAKSTSDMTIVKLRDRLTAE